MFAVELLGCGTLYYTGGNVVLKNAWIFIMMILIKKEKAMSEKLRECPFCGCKMEIFAVGRDWWRIAPETEHGINCIFTEDSCIEVSKDDTQKALLIRDWNTRTTTREARRLGRA